MHSSGRPGLGYRVSVSVIVRVRNQEARLSEIFFMYCVFFAAVG